MSRTYRRKNGKKNGYLNEEWYTRDYVRLESPSDPGYFYYAWVWLDPKSREVIVALAKFHGDHGTHSCKEPGPSWFRNLTTERPARRHAKRELQKFMQDPDYEPMILPMDPLEYWT